ncbi:DUF6998 domain-containing protein [Gimesia chilikensis]|uniref:DUF6998 domain-containing protein n=1 Tax=Gimesia chilikensis TaxID=2605989 RepID=UPI0018E074B6|nr:hypothetical protein [Gimesia chilikensis]
MASEQTGDFNTSRSSNVAKDIQDIYALVDHLESLFPGRHFTPDGHMVGSIGEVLAEEQYDLELYEASEPLHDAISKCGREVQIKATQSSRIALRGDRAPEHPIVLSLNADGRTAEVFNGPANLHGRMLELFNETDRNQLA